MLYLIEGAIMPGQGIYLYNALNQNQLAYACQEGRKQGVLRSRILNKETCDFLSTVAGVMILPPVPKKDGTLKALELVNADQLIHVQVVRPTIADKNGKASPQVMLRTVLMTHFNDNPNGIGAMLRMYATEAPDEQATTAYNNAATTLEHGFIEATDKSGDAGE